VWQNRERAQEFQAIASRCLGSPGSSTLYQLSFEWFAGAYRHWLVQWSVSALI